MVLAGRIGSVRTGVDERTGVTENQEREAPIQTTAPNGVTWTRVAGGMSTSPQLLQALADLRGFSTVSHQWNWWQEGRRDQEHDRLWEVLGEWENSADRREHTEVELEAFAQAELDKVDKRLEEDRQRRTDLVAQSYDKDRENLQLTLLRAESDAAFFAHVLEAPASPAQRQDAERRMADRRSTVDELRRQLGDPEQVIDRHGHLPAERREMHLREHMDHWRHPLLRKLATKDRRRFNVLLKMPTPDPTAMCSECQAPAEWHEYDISLQLFQPPPPAGSQAETLSRLMPGWWERCPASTAYQIGHVWGGKQALPDFDGEQWRTMLPPLLRTIFAPAPPKPKREPHPKPEPLAVISP